MRKLALILLLSVFGVTEMCLFTAILPAKWQNAMFSWVATALPQSHDNSAITHPALEHEMDQAAERSARLQNGALLCMASPSGGKHVCVIGVLRGLRRNQVSPGASG
jgi:hypothetical protein